MDPEKKKRLENKGWHVGDVQEFLGLSDAEMRLVEMRERLAEAVRRRRTESGMTQPQLAKALKTSQSRVSMIESAKAGVSMDQIVTALLAIGATASEVSAAVSGSAPASAVRRSAVKPKAATRRTK